jgi:hemin uptake protein HemP
MTLQAQQSFDAGQYQPAPAPVPIHRAQDLTRGGSLAQIVLDGKVYALRITRQGKLILTK